MRGALLTILLVCVTPSGAAHARSVLELPYPPTFGQFEAITYDESGSRLGTAELAIERLHDGRIRMSVNTRIDHGPSNEASIVLEPVDGTALLRAVEQRSESRDAAGRSLGVLRVDHAAGIGHCSKGDGSDGSQSIPLPDHERIANVALNLLFSPMALGEATSADFEVFVCRGGPRVIGFSASREPRAAGGLPRDQIVEIRYKPDLGPAIEWMAGAWLPQFSFWLDGQGNYLAHRVPLYSDGPEVLVVRNGTTPLMLTAAP